MAKTIQQAKLWGRYNAMVKDYEKDFKIMVYFLMFCQLFLLKVKIKWEAKENLMLLSSPTHNHFQIFSLRLRSCKNAIRHYP